MYITSLKVYGFYLSSSELIPYMHTNFLVARDIARDARVCLQESPVVSQVVMLNYVYFWITHSLLKIRVARLVIGST